MLMFTSFTHLLPPAGFDRRLPHFVRQRTAITRTVTSFRCHTNCAKRGMQKSQSSLSQFALEALGITRLLVDAVQRRDRDLGSQLRRALSSVPLNLAEGFGSTGGNARLRFQSAYGSLQEARTAIEVAVAWGYVTETLAAVPREALGRLSARIYGLLRA